VSESAPTPTLPLFDITVEIRTKRSYRIQAADEEKARTEALTRVWSELPDREIVDLRRVRFEEEECDAER
jgi:hypothetical protein